MSAAKATGYCSVSLLCNIQLVYLYIITSHPVLSLPFLLVFSSLFSEFCQLNSMRFALPKYCMLLAGVNTLQSGDEDGYSCSPRCSKRVRP